MLYDKSNARSKVTGVTCIFMIERQGVLTAAHGPNCALATHAGRNPPLGDLLSQRRGPLPKLLWADLLISSS